MNAIHVPELHPNLQTFLTEPGMSPANGFLCHTRATLVEDAMSDMADVLRRVLSPKRTQKWLDFMTADAFVIEAAEHAGGEA